MKEVMSKVYRDQIHIITSQWPKVPDYVLNSQSSGYTVTNLSWFHENLPDYQGAQDPFQVVCRYMVLEFIKELTVKSHDSIAIPPFYRR